MINFISTLKIEKAYEMNRAVNELFKYYPINNEDRYFPDINSKREMNDFIAGVFLDTIYNEKTKEFTNYLNSYHFVNGFNFFVGARITHNRAEFTKEVIDQSHTDYTWEIRQDNYYGQTNQRMDNIQTDTFGSENITYSEDGGYKGKGGFVHFFNSTATDKQAHIQHKQMVKDGLLDEHLISLTLETIFYNANFQVGVYLVYQFMFNNAGQLQVYENTKFFQESHYNFGDMDFLMEYIFGKDGLIIYDIMYLFG